MKPSLALLMIASCLSACSPSPSGDAAGAPRMVGRYLENEQGVKEFAWPASGIEAKFTGSKLVAVLEDTGINLIDVTVDGETTVLHLKPGRETYTVFEAAERGTHHIALTRRSEIFEQGLTGFVGMDTDGEFLALPPVERRILFLGDSISVGFGAEGADEHCPYSAETGAPLKAWSSLTAEAFGAQLHNISVSGRGLMRNWDLSDSTVMNLLFDRTLPDQAAIWDHSKWQPDVVVINLGTNDFSPGDPGDAFTDAYEQQLIHIREVYPDARIYATFLGEATPGVPNTLQLERIGTAAQRRVDAGDTKVSTVTLHMAGEGRVWGCGYHPGLDSHRRMAGDLIARIAADTGWDPAK